MNRKIGYLYIGVYATLLVWVAFAISQIENSDFALASAFGLSAYCIMWAHYFNGFVNERFFPDVPTKKSYQVTRTVVLPSIILHAFLINYILFDKGYGLPPNNYSYFGDDKFFIYLGVMSLVIFFIFDMKKFFVEEI